MLLQRGDPAHHARDLACPGPPERAVTLPAGHALLESRAGPAGRAP
jgi:hypothetical protein